MIGIMDRNRQGVSENSYRFPKTNPMFFYVFFGLFFIPFEVLFHCMLPTAILIVFY